MKPVTNASTTHPTASPRKSRIRTRTALATTAVVAAADTFTAGVGVAQGGDENSRQGKAAERETAARLPPRPVPRLPARPGPRARTTDLHQGGQRPHSRREQRVEEQQRPERRGGHAPVLEPAPRVGRQP